MSGILAGLAEGETAASEVLAEVVKEAPSAMALVTDVINFLHLHFPGAAGLPQKPDLGKPAPVEPAEPNPTVGEHG